MANMLTGPELSRAWKTYRARIVIATSFFMLGTAFAAALALAPSLFTLESAQAALPSMNASSTQAQQYQKDTLAITQTNFMTAQLSAILLSTTTPPEETIAAILAQKPSGVHISQITYTAGPSGTILIGGTAGSGSTISAYRAALSQNSGFTSVSVPVASLIGSQTGAFTITISGSF